MMVLFLMKRFSAALIILFILTLAIVPINLFLINMPEFISIILSVLIIAADVLYIIKTGGKKVRKSVYSVLSVIFIAIGLFCTYCNPFWNSLSFKLSVDSNSIGFDEKLSSKDAVEDLDYAMKYLKKDHPALKNSTPKMIQAQYEKAKAELLKEDTVDVCTLNREIESVFSLLNDAHTCVKALFPDDHYLKYYYSRNEEGAILTAVNDVNLEDMLKNNRALYSYEVESWGLHSLSNDLMTKEGLSYLGIDTKDGVTYTYLCKDGRYRTYTYSDSDFVTRSEYYAFNNVTKSVKPFVSYEIDKDRSLAVLTLTSCKFNDEYRDCVKKMFTEVKNLGIQNVAVDIRNNDGGSSFVADEFIRYLDVDNYRQPVYTIRLGFFDLTPDNGNFTNNKYNDLLFKGNVYMLTSVHSFSSAMDFAQYIKDNKLGTIIGEAPGNTPVGYGQCTEMKLPHSQIYMQISTTTYQRTDPNCKDELVLPDIECKSDSAIYVLHDNLTTR